MAEAAGVDEERVLWVEEARCAAAAESEEEASVAAGCAAGGIAELEGISSGEADGWAAASAGVVGAGAGIW